MFNKAQRRNRLDKASKDCGRIPRNFVVFTIKAAKLARLKNTGKFGCTVSVFNMSVVIVVRLL